MIKKQKNPDRLLVQACLPLPVLLSFSGTVANSYIITGTDSFLLYLRVENCQHLNSLSFRIVFLYFLGRMVFRGSSNQADMKSHSVCQSVQDGFQESKRCKGDRLPAWIKVLLMISFVLWTLRKMSLKGGVIA